MQRYVHQDLNVYLCPVREYCSAFHEGRQEELPVKTKKIKKKFIPVASFAIKNAEGKWLLGKRPEKGLLANLWEFPMVELNGDKTPAEAFTEQYGVDLTELFDIINFKHVFSHLTWEMKSFQARLTEDENDSKRIPFFYGRGSGSIADACPCLENLGGT